MKLVSGFALVLLVVQGLACGSSDNGGSSGSGAAALQSCQAWCDAAASCSDFGYTDAAECKTADTGECSGIDASSGACASAIKAFYDCQKAATDVCNPACTAEADAYLNACT